MSERRRQRDVAAGPRKARRESPHSPSGGLSPPWRSPGTVTGLAGVLLATIVVFAPVRTHQLTNWDDESYVTKNIHIRTLGVDSIRTMFTTPTVVSNYHPLTLLSLALDYRLSGVDPSTYHLTNLALHVLNTLLVFVFFARFSGGRTEIGLIVALFFGIHPMHVESVAWVSSRKDVLYAFFFLLSLISYLGTMHPGAHRRTRAAFWVLTALFFAASVLSKPAAVVLPVVLLLIDYYRDRPISKRMFAEKVPLLAISLLSGVLTIRAQASVINVEYFTLVERIMIASHGFVRYLLKLVAPVHLSAFYPYPPVAAELPATYALAPFAVIGIGAVVAWSARRTRVVVFGAGFFAVTLALVLQFIKVGDAVIADRYTYLPYLGPLFIVASAYSFVHRRNGSRWPPRKALFAGGLVVYALVLSFAAHQRTKVWVDSMTLWSDVLDQHPDDVPVAYNNRGTALRGVGRHEEAIADFGRAIAINPRYAKAYMNRANIHFIQGRAEDAIVDYDKALEIDPGLEEAYANRGNALAHAGNVRAALADFSRAIELDPHYLDTYLDRAQVYLDSGRNEDGIADLDRYLALETTNPEAFYARAVAKQRLRRYAASLPDFDAAIRLRPRESRFFASRSSSYDALGQWAKALEDARFAVSLGARVSSEYTNRLERSLASREGDEETAALRAAIEAKPDDRSARSKLASHLIDRGKIDEAHSVLRGSIERWPCDTRLHTELANLSLRRQGRTAQVAVLDEFVRRCAAPPEIMNDLAYLLASAHEPEVRDPQRALDLAKRAVAAYGEHPQVLDTLSAAYAANGRFDEALATSARALAAGERFGLSESDLATIRKHRATLETRTPIRE